MKHKIIRGLPLISALIVVVGVLVYNHARSEAFADRPLAPPKQEVKRATVTVMTVRAGKYQSRVVGFGEASPHYTLTLNAQVAGHVNTIASGFETGHRVSSGTALARLEDSRYQEALSAAKNTLASARVSLLEEERQGAQAAAEWKSSGLAGKPDSPLVLREPQLAAARAQVAQAQSALASARFELKQTRISAPFDALITARQVSPGSYVQAGSEVATLVSTDRMEISVSLSGKDWAQLADANKLVNRQWPVTLSDVENGQRWEGHVLRVEQHLDEATRQRNLIVAVDSPFDQEPELYPGAFLQASLGGREVQGLWKLPASSLSQSGEIWYVTPEQTLASFTTEPAFSGGGSVFIPAPEALAGRQQQIIVRPLSNYLEGMPVSPVEDKANG